MARQEGWGIVGAIPTVRNNPLDLRHSPHSTHAGIGEDDVGIVDTIEHGWEDAERQLQLWGQRGLTIQQAIETQTGWDSRTGDVDGNDTPAYIAAITSGLGMAAAVSVARALGIPAV